MCLYLKRFGKYEHGVSIIESTCVTLFRTRKCRFLALSRDPKYRPGRIESGTADSTRTRQSLGAFTSLVSKSDLLPSIHKSLRKDKDEITDGTSTKSLYEISNFSNVESLVISSGKAEI